jgi:hypothetical protein
MLALYESEAKTVHRMNNVSKKSAENKNIIKSGCYI